MSMGEPAPEPSMDEILSSIRKIIADDEAGDGADPRTPARSGAAATSPNDAGAEDDDDDILELTEDDESPAADGLERAGVGDDVPTAPHSTAEPESDRADPAPAADGPTEPAQAELEADQDPAMQRIEAAGMAKAMSDVLLDRGTAKAASGALHRLSAAMAPGTAIPEGDRTVEAFLTDLVRPEIKTWLDQHLPALVERVVEREIKRLVRDAQPD